ncbi:hypothetical protein D8S78_21115 [Natrialba swarupiae]|nr:hypothetical protein [Natrialba swarupiae]
MTSRAATVGLAVEPIDAIYRVRKHLVEVGVRDALFESLRRLGVDQKLLRDAGRVRRSRGVMTDCTGFRRGGGDRTVVGLVDANLRSNPSPISGCTPREPLTFPIAV